MRRETYETLTQLRDLRRLYLSREHWRAARLVTVAIRLIFEELLKCKKLK